MHNTETNRSTAGLLSDLASQLMSLFQKEGQLVRTEISESIHRAVGALAGMMIGAILLIGAVNVLLGAVVTALVAMNVPAPWAALIVAIVVGVVGALIMWGAMRNLSLSRLAPTRSAEQIRRDAQLAKETVQ